MPRQIVVRCTFLLALLSLFADRADANIRCVNPGGTDGCYASIQAAVDAAIELDTILIAPGTYNEKVSLQPPNNKTLTIQGAGAERTIVDGTGVAPANAPVFQLPSNGPNGLAIAIVDLTVRGGYRGIDTGRFTRVSLTNLVIRDNGPGSGAGVFANANFVTIRNSVIRDNVADDAFFGCDGSGGAGGGIGAFCGGAHYTIIDSAIVNNRARLGGGATFVNGFQTIINSTFSGNHATDPNGIGAAMMSFADRTYISNSTIADNTVRPGGGALALFSSYVEMRGNLVQHNAGGNCNTDSETITSVGYNVISDATCDVAGPGDQQDVAAVLGPLQINGGDTPTHALKAGPGTDVLPASQCPAPARDQRGMLRAQGAACDAGAFEATTAELVVSLYELAVVLERGHLFPNLVRKVQKALDAGKIGDACSLLGQMQNEVTRAVSKGKFTAEEGAALTQALNSVRHTLGC